MNIDCSVDLDKYRMNDDIRATYREYKNRLTSDDRRGVYSKYDWRRISYAFDLLPPEATVLEVGFGSGQLINSLASSGGFSAVSGLDVAVHSKFIRLSDDFDIHVESIDQMSFPDDAFDCVVCMEVLEHIGPKMFKRGLKQLRRVCKKQLIMSVPYNEPLPLPSYHKQRFTDADIDAYFPDAKKHMLYKPNVPWLLLEERL